MPETHYVLIVHGTWNAPEAGKTKWYQKGGAFANALAQGLESTPLAGVVWRSCAGKPIDFSWCGHNSHECRVKAAERFSEMILAVRAADETARIHIIAHSHGGNVVLKALELYFSKLARYARERHAREEYPGPMWALPHWADKAVDWVSEALRLPTRSPLPSRAAPIDHRIGRLVFLGTPFLHKRWHRHKWRFWLRLIVNGIAGIPIAMLLVYLGILSALGEMMTTTSPGLLIRDLLPWKDSKLPPLEQYMDEAINRLNPITWPGWCHLLILLLAFGIGLAATRRRRDVNLYHMPPPHWDASVTRVSALVVSAGQLDEALLGLSAEPLVDAYLRPEINKLTRWQMGWSLSVPTAATASALAEPILRACAWLVLAVRNVAKLLAYPLGAAMRRLFRIYLQKSIRRLMLAQASGLPPHEFNSASLAVRPDIGVTEVFEEAKVWNVAELVAGAPSLLPAEVEKERYAFLWSPDTLAERLPQSRIWSRLSTKDAQAQQTRYAGCARGRDQRQEGERHWAILERERGYSLDDEELLALKRACLVIEEKARELGGSVQLSHSGYYGHPRIVDAVAAFLVTGQRPADA